MPLKRQSVIYGSALVNKISDNLKNHIMSLLIRSPSLTGKTSLANFMNNHWRQNGKNAHFILFASLQDDEDVFEFFIEVFNCMLM